MSKQDAQVGGENHYEWDMRRGTARETVSAWPDILQIICDGFESLPGSRKVPLVEGQCLNLSFRDSMKAEGAEERRQRILDAGGEY